MSLLTAFMGNPNKTYNFDKEPMYDRFLLVIVLMLITLGLIVVYTSSIAVTYKIGAEEFHYVKRQCLFVIGGFFVGFLFLHIPTATLAKYCKNIVVILVLLACLSTVFIGAEIKGAKRWIDLGFFNFQPSETMKMVWIIFLAGFIDRHKTKITYMRQPFKIYILLGFIIAVFYLQKDLGSVVVISSITIMMLFIANCSMRVLLGTAILGIAFVSLAIIFTPYRLARLMTFLDPWSDPSSNGYQVTLSLMAYGRGHIFGEGLGNSVFKLSYIPDPQTDFVSAVWGEETGLIGILILLLIEILLVIKCLMIGFESFRSKLNQNVFHGEIAVGLAMWFLLQITINIGSACGLLPTKGLTLPFISYGGSSLIMMLVSVCVLLRITYERRQFALDNIMANIKIAKQLKKKVNNSNTTDSTGKKVTVAE